MALRARTAAVSLAFTVVGLAPRAAGAQVAATPDPDEPALEALALALAVAPVPPQAEPDRADAIQEPRVELVVTFAARSLVFDEVPRIRMTFGGSGPRKAVWKVERTNLPARVERGVEYRDVKVRLTLTSTVDEFEALIDDARRVASGIRAEK